MNSSPGNQHFISEQKEKSVKNNFRTFPVIMMYFLFQETESRSSSGLDPAIIAVIVVVVVLLIVVVAAIIFWRCYIIKKAKTQG